MDEMGSLRTASVLLILALAALMTFVVGPASAAGPIAMPVLANTFLFGGVLCGVFWLLWFIIWIMVAVWVYRDAESRGQSGVLWLIVVILLGLIGLIIYLIVRPGQPQPPPGYAPPPGYYPPPGYAAPPPGYAPPPQYPPQYPPQQPPAPPPQ